MAIALSRYRYLNQVFGMWFKFQRDSVALPRCVIRSRPHDGSRRAGCITKGACPVRRAGVRNRQW
jgi:hypothetical protein